MQDDPQFDRQLVQRVAAGEFEAFATLASRHAPALFTIARRLLGNLADAEDVLQTTLAKALEHIRTYREEGDVGAWMRTIARNASISIIRAREMHRTQSIHADAELPMPDYVADWRPGAVEHAEQNELRQQLQQALDRLDERHRSVFVLREIEDLSVKETADKLNITESNVKIRLMRARLMLREMLTRAFGSGPNLRVDHAHDAPHVGGAS